jgi:integral membrane protein (TIGR01906 family)
MLNPKLISAIRWLVVIAIPFLLALGTLRLMITWNSPSYPEFEYPRISPDPFGLSQEERLELARANLDYLRRPEPAAEVIFLLEDLRLSDTGEPLYNQREIGHMLDVKNLVDTFKNLTWIVAIVVIAGLIFLFVRPETRVEGYRALFHGGLLTTGVLLLVLILILLSWNLVFTQFHEILFPPDTWTFDYSDSLIRLFPEKFWFDFGLFWTGAIFLEGLLLALIGYFLLRSSS